MANAISIDIPLKKANVLGFGEYDLPEGKTFDQMQWAAKAQKIAFSVLFGVLSIASLLLIPVSLPLSVLVSVGFSSWMIRDIIQTIGIGNRAPPMGGLFPPEVLTKLPPLGEFSAIPSSGFPTKGGVDSQSWKEELIRAARKSIVLSGCYCGGRVFNSTLDLMAERMRLFPELKINIISSRIMITNENKARIQAMRTEFPEQFTLLETPEMFPMVAANSDFTMTSNHTKILVVDYGVYYMLGGSGITSAWAEQEGVKKPENIEVGSGCLNHAMDALFKMRAFKDMDFVFQSPVNGAGTRLYVEMMRLFERLRYRQEGNIKPPVIEWSDPDSLTCERFEENKIEGLKAACYASGPEQVGNQFLEELVTQIEGAQESIVIDNLYFHPPEKLFKALVRASNRGVKITILTNEDGEVSPGSHAFYAQRSIYFARRLYEGKPKANVEIYVFAVEHTSLHKKVMIVDGKTTLFGSANMGKRSLENVDYEINLKIESTDFAAAVQQEVELDKAICNRIPPSSAHKIPFLTKIIAPVQSICMIFA